MRPRDNPLSPQETSRATLATRFMRKRLCALVFLTLSGCSMERSETARVTAPDGHATAVLTEEVGGGAAGAGRYYLYIIESRHSHELKSPNFMATGCPGLSAVWENNKFLTLKYPSDCYIRSFINHWYSSSNIQNGGSVEIVLERYKDGWSE
jgi:hypothetical protein